MKGWTEVRDKPVYVHDCDRCWFLFSVKTEEGLAVDVYQNCDAHERRNSRWILRYSSDGPDYTTVTLASLVVGHSIAHRSDWSRAFS